MACRPVVAKARVSGRTGSGPGEENNKGIRAQPIFSIGSHCYRKSITRKQARGRPFRSGLNNKTDKKADLLDRARHAIAKVLISSIEHKPKSKRSRGTEPGSMAARGTPRIVVARPRQGVVYVSCCGESVRRCRPRPGDDRVTSVVVGVVGKRRGNTPTPQRVRYAVAASSQTTRTWRSCRQGAGSQPG